MLSPVINAIAVLRKIRTSQRQHWIGCSMSSFSRSQPIALDYRLRWGRRAGAASANPPRAHPLHLGEKTLSPVCYVYRRIRHRTKPGHFGGLDVMEGAIPTGRAELVWSFPRSGIWHGNTLLKLSGVTLTFRRQPYLYCTQFQ